MYVELDLCLSTLDIKPIVWSSLAPVKPHHVAADILEPQTAIRGLHCGLSSWHQKVLFCSRPENRWTGFTIHHQAHQLSITSLSYTDHLSSWWNCQHWRRDWREGKGRETWQRLDSVFLHINWNNHKWYIWENVLFVFVFFLPKTDSKGFKETFVRLILFYSRKAQPVIIC